MNNCNVIQSFSAKGYPYDNAVAESFFKFLKIEELNRQTFYTKAQLEFSLFEYIDGFYNTQTPHSANGNIIDTALSYYYILYTLFQKINH